MVANLLPETTRRTALHGITVQTSAPRVLSIPLDHSCTNLAPLRSTFEFLTLTWKPLRGGMGHMYWHALAIGSRGHVLCSSTGCAALIHHQAWGCRSLHAPVAYDYHVAVQAGQVSLAPAHGKGNGSLSPRGTQLTALFKHSTSALTAISFAMLPRVTVELQSKQAVNPTIIRDK